MITRLKLTHVMLGGEYILTGSAECVTGGYLWILVFMISSPCLTMTGFQKDTLCRGWMIPLGNVMRG